MISAAASEEYLNAIHFANPSQMNEDGGGERGQRNHGIDTHTAAIAGVSGTATALPHGAAIKESFGPDHAATIDGISAHVGGPAATAAIAIGAKAYATGTSIAFAESPDLHTAAHEVAHVVQQRQGVSLKGGVGTAGDQYEQHADAVADHVVDGGCAADLLAAGPTSSWAGSSRSVQRQASMAIAQQPATTPASPQPATPGPAPGAAAAAQPGAQPGASLFPQAVWSFALVPGAHGDGMPRAASSTAITAFVGDQLNVAAAFNDHTPLSSPDARLEISVQSRGVTPPTIRRDPAELHPIDLSQRLHFDGAGEGVLNILVVLPYAAPVARQVPITIYNDARGVFDSATAAGMLVQHRYDKAGERFNMAAKNYGDAFAAHESLLTSVQESERASYAAIMSILFAVTSAPFGTGASAAFSPWISKVTKDKLVQGFATDTAKDLAKAAARLMWSSSGHSGAGAAGDGPLRAGGGAATGRAGETGHSDFAAAAEDPLRWFLGAQIVLKNEEAQATGILYDIQMSALRGIDENQEIATTLNPLAIVERTCTIDGHPMDQLAPPPSPDDYQVALWAAWLSEHAYKLQKHTARSYGDIWETYSVEPMTGDLRSAISARLKELGVTPDFLEQYSDMARVKTETQYDNTPH